MVNRSHDWLLIKKRLIDTFNPILMQDPRSGLYAGEGLGEFGGARIPVGEQYQRGIQNFFVGGSDSSGSIRLHIKMVIHAFCCENEK